MAGSSSFTFIMTNFSFFTKKYCKPGKHPGSNFRFFIKISVKLTSRFSRSENSFLPKSESRSLRPPGLNRAHLDDYLSRPILGEKITPRDRPSKRELIFEIFHNFRLLIFPSPLSSTKTSSKQGSHFFNTQNLSV